MESVNTEREWGGWGVYYAVKKQTPWRREMGREGNSW